MDRVEFMGFEFRDGYAYWLTGLGDSVIELILSTLDVRYPSIGKRVLDLDLGILCLSYSVNSWELFSSVPFNRKSVNVLFNNENKLICHEYSLIVENNNIEDMEENNNISIIPAGSIKEVIEKHTSKKMLKMISTFNERAEVNAKEVDIVDDFKVILNEKEFNNAFITLLNRSGYITKIINDVDDIFLDVRLGLPGPQYR